MTIFTRIEKSSKKKPSMMSIEFAKKKKPVEKPKKKVVKKAEAKE